MVHTAPESALELLLALVPHSDYLHLGIDDPEEHTEAIAHEDVPEVLSPRGGLGRGWVPQRERGQRVERHRDIGEPYLRPVLGDLPLQRPPNLVCEYAPGIGLSRRSDYDFVLTSGIVRSRAMTSAAGRPSPRASWAAPSLNAASVSNSSSRSSSAW